MASATAGRSGIELLQAMIAGAFAGPSMGRTLGFTLVSVADGEAVFEGVPTDAFLNPMGIVHGGWALSLIDSACGCAAHTTLGADIGYTTIETKANFVRAIRADAGAVRCIGTVVARGRRVITAEARLVDGAGKLLAHGTSTLMVFV